MLRHRNAELARRLAILRLTPFSPGSRSVGTDEEWSDLSARFPHSRVFIHGTGSNALVYTFDAMRERVMIVDGEPVP